MAYTEKQVEQMKRYFELVDFEEDNLNYIVRLSSNVAIPVICKLDIHFENKEKISKYDVVGPICESGDILGKERDLPAMNEGDYLVILDTGAYGYTMSSPYNSRTRPAELLINDGNVYKIRNEETIDDLIRGQSVPDHLK